MRKTPATNPAHPPLDPGHPHLTPATIRDPDLLRATLGGRDLTTLLGWYRVQEDWTKLTVKALRDLTTPGNGLHEAIVDLLLWRARKNTQGQHVWIPAIKWGQALTHDTDINVTRRGTVRLRRAPAERDHPADPNRPEQWEQSTAPTRDTALRAAGLRTLDDNLPPPPTDSDHPLPEVWCTVLERGHYYVIAATATSPGPPWLVKGTDTMLAPGAAPPGAVGDPTSPQRVLRGVLQPGDKPPYPRPGPNHLREGGLPPGTGHALPDPLDPAPLANHGDGALDLGHPHRPHTNRGGPGHAVKPPPPRPQHSLTCRYHAIHRVLSRVGFSPELPYPLPTTDQDVHQIRKLVCEILAAAAEEGKLLLQTTRPTTDHASAPLRADTYTDTTHPTAQSPPMPPPSRCSAGDPNSFTIARTPWPRDTGLPHPLEHQHMRDTDPPARHPSPCPHTRQPAHTRGEEPRAPRHAHPTQWPPHAPRAHPRRPRPTPPGP